MQSFCQLMMLIFFVAFLWVFHKVCWTLRCYEMCTGHFWWFYMKPEEVQRKGKIIYIFRHFIYKTNFELTFAHKHQPSVYITFKKWFAYGFFLSLSSPVQSHCVQLISHPIPFDCRSKCCPENAKKKTGRKKKKSP